MTNLAEIRAKFPVGTKVKLIEMKDEQARQRDAQEL